jgi:hypothetical protein
MFCRLSGQTILDSSGVITGVCHLDTYDTDAVIRHQAYNPSRRCRV